MRESHVIQIDLLEEDDKNPLVKINNLANILLIKSKLSF